MLTFLCGLTAEQWKVVHQYPPSGSVEDKPEGYRLAGLYEGKANHWLIQFYKGTGYRYWNYSNVFQPPVDEDECDLLCEMAVQALDKAQEHRANASHLLEEAARLEQVAADRFRDALIGPVCQPIE